LVTVVPAYAQQPPVPQSDDREIEAREMFGVGRYAEALGIFGKLYAETMHPTYMRNIARCYQNLGEPEKAISSFREYLRQVKDLAPDQRAMVEGYIREMEELKRKRDAERTSPAEPAAVPAHTPAPPVGEPVSVAASEAPTAQSWAQPGVKAPLLAESGSDSLSHRGRFGAFVRMDVGLQVPALVLAPGLSLGIGDRVEVLTALLLGNYFGFWTGGRAFLTTGRWKALLSMGIPAFLVAPAVESSRGFSFGVQGGGGMQWDFSRAFGAFAELTVAYFPGVDAALRAFWVLPTFGLQGRL
jgi:hypothetical protein